MKNLFVNIVNLLHKKSVMQLKNLPEPMSVGSSHKDNIMPKLISTKTNLALGVAITLLASAIVITTLGLSMSAAHANVNSNQVNAYATAMKTAANAQDIQNIGALIADDAAISITRDNKSWTVGKADYLKLLQDSWQSSSNYSYSIDITDVVTTGKNAKANVKTVERMTKNGQPITFITESRATLTEGNGGALLLRSVSQITIK